MDVDVVGFDMPQAKVQLLCHATWSFVSLGRPASWAPFSPRKRHQAEGEGLCSFRDLPCKPQAGSALVSDVSRLRRAEALQP